MTQKYTLEIDKDTDLIINVMVQVALKNLMFIAGLKKKGLKEKMDALIYQMNKKSHEVFECEDPNCPEK